MARFSPTALHQCCIEHESSALAFLRGGYLTCAYTRMDRYARINLATYTPYLWFVGVKIDEIEFHKFSILYGGKTICHWVANVYQELCMYLELYHWPLKPSTLGWMVSGRRGD